MSYILTVIMKFESQRDWERFQRDALDPSIRLPVQPIWYDVIGKEEFCREEDE